MIEDYKSQSIEKSIHEFEAAALDLFDEVLELYSDCSEIKIEKLIQHCKIPDHALNAKAIVIGTLQQISANFTEYDERPLAAKAKAFFGNGRYYRTVQALANFRRQYYNQLTTSNYDVAFAAKAVKDLLKIQAFYKNSNCDFGIVHDQIIDFLFYHRPHVIDLDACYIKFSADLNDIQDARIELRTLLDGFIQHCINGIFTAFILSIDMHARNAGIDIKPKDCGYIFVQPEKTIYMLPNLLPLLQKLQPLPDLVMAILDMSKYTSCASIAETYKVVATCFEKNAKLLTALDQQHPFVSRCMPMCQALNKAVIFNDGSCDGGAAILLHSDLSRFYHAPRVQSFAKYTDIDALEITSEIYQRQSNQFSKRLTDLGDHFTQEILKITNNHAAALLYTVYNLAQVVLDKSTEANAKILVHMFGQGSGHAVGFYAYKLQDNNNNPYINFLFIDLNYGIFRFKLFADETHKLNRAILSFFTQIFKEYSWIKTCEVKLHLSKSPSLPLLLSGIKNLNLKNAAHNILTNNMRDTHFNARYDNEKRNNMYALNARLRQGDDSCTVLMELLEQGQSIADKTLVDYYMILKSYCWLIGQMTEKKDFAQANLYLDRMRQINATLQHALLRSILEIAIALLNGYVNEKHILGSGETFFTNAYVMADQQGYSIQVLQFLLDIRAKSGKDVADTQNALNALLAYLTARITEVGMAMAEQGDFDIHSNKHSEADQLYLASYIAYCAPHKVIDENHGNTSIIALDKPNVQLRVLTQRTLPITFLFNPAPHYTLSVLFNGQRDGEDHLVKPKCLALSCALG